MTIQSITAINSSHPPQESRMKYSSILISAIFLTFLSSITRSEPLKVTNTVTAEDTSFTTWHHKPNACNYAIAAARNKAVKQCTDEKGKAGKIVKIEQEDGRLVTPLNKSCHSCTLKKNKEWRCMGSVTVRCKYIMNKPETSLIKGMRGSLREQTAAESPCNDDPKGTACRQHKIDQNTAGGVRN
jgi:hypothetical protein